MVLRTFRPAGGGGRGVRYGMVWDGSGILRQTACKPGSVPGQAWRRPFIWDARCRTPLATDPGGYAEVRFVSGVKPAENRRPYLVLLPVGFAVPVPLPAPRCALTAPFHPYPSEGGRFAFCGTFPGVAPAGCYPAPYFRGARTFLSPPRRKAAVQPSGASAEWGRRARTSSVVMSKSIKVLVNDYTYAQWAVEIFSVCFQFYWCSFFDC